MAILHVTLCAVLLASLTVCSSQSAAEPATRLEEPQQQLDDKQQPAILLSARSNLDFSNVNYGQPDNQQLAINSGNNAQAKDGEDMNTDELRWGWGRGWGGYRRGFGGFGWGGFGGYGGYGGWGGYGGYRGYRGYWGGYPYRYGGWGYYG